MKSSEQQLIDELTRHLDTILEYGCVTDQQAPWLMPMSEGVPFERDDKKGFDITAPPICVDVRIEAVKHAHLRIPDIIDELRLATDELAYNLSLDQFTKLESLQADK